jgi:regulator of chromosome condensation
MFLSVCGRRIYTCGRCDSGQLGIEDEVPEAGDFRNRMQLLPFDIKDPDEDLNFKQIAAGENSCFAVTRTGKLYSWGFGDSGQLGHGRNADQLRATSVKKFAKEESGFVLEVASGSQHTIVLANREMVKNEIRGPSDAKRDNERLT